MLVAEVELYTKVDVPGVNVPVGTKGVPDPVMVVVFDPAS